MLVKISADFSRDCESGNGKTDVGHLGEVCAFAAEPSSFHGRPSPIAEIKQTPVS
jgi:hypothetical protein